MQGGSCAVCDVVGDAERLQRPHSVEGGFCGARAPVPTFDSFYLPFQSDRGVQGLERSRV